MITDDVDRFRSDAEIDRRTNETVRAVRVLHPFPRRQRFFLQETKTCFFSRGEKHCARSTYVVNAHVETSHREEQTDFVSGTGMFGIR